MIVRYGMAALACAWLLVAGMGAAGTCAAQAVTQATPQTVQTKPDPAGWVAPPVIAPVDMPPLVPAPPVNVPAPKADNLPFPKWSEFPVPPTDVPTVAEIAQRVKSQNDLNKAFNARLNALVWDNYVPEAFAETTREAMNPEYSKPVDMAETQKEMQDILSHQVVPPPIVKD